MLKSVIIFLETYLKSSAQLADPLHVAQARVNNFN